MQAMGIIASTQAGSRTWSGHLARPTASAVASPAGTAKRLITHPRLRGQIIPRRFRRAYLSCSSFWWWPSRMGETAGIIRPPQMNQQSQLLTPSSFDVSPPSQCNPGSLEDMNCAHHSRSGSRARRITSWRTVLILVYCRVARSFKPKTVKSQTGFSVQLVGLTQAAFWGAPCMWMYSSVALAEAGQ
jgi:hypothetical protein